MDFSKLLYGFFRIDPWISQSCNMDLFELLSVFINVVLCISRPFPNKCKLKFDQRFCFELKGLNESKYSCLGSVMIFVAH